MQQTHRMRLGSVGAYVHRALAVLHVVVRIGHGAITPGVGDAGHRGGVTDARLMVAVVRAPEADQLAHQVSLLVVVLGGTYPVNGVRTAGLAQFQHAFTDFRECRIPADTLVLAVHQLHRVAQSELAMPVLTQRSALGAMRSEVDGRIEHRFLTHPDAVLDHRIDRAANRAMRAHRSLDLDLAVADGDTARSSVRLADQRELRCRQTDTNAQTRATQEDTPVHGRQGRRKTTAQTVNKRKMLAWADSARFLGQQHGSLQSGKATELRQVWSCNTV